MEGLEFRSLACELRASADGGEFEGLASVFHTPDASWSRDIIAPGAFAADLPLFLSEGFAGGMNHDWDQPIGRVLAAEERADGLYVRAAISDTQHGRDVRTLLRDGVVKRLSIGFRAVTRRFLETADDVAAWWAAQGYGPSAEDRALTSGGARLLTRIRLYEFSPVAVPAQRRAVITGVKGADPGAGVGLDEHGARVLADLGEFVARLEAAGGELAAEHRAGVASLCGQLDALRGGTAAVSGVRPPPAAALRSGEGRRLYADFLRIEAGIKPGEGGGGNGAWPGGAGP